MHHDAADDAAILRHGVQRFQAAAAAQQDVKSSIHMQKLLTLTTMLPLTRPSCVAACSALRLLPPPDTKTASLASGRAAPVCGSGTLEAAAAAAAGAAADIAALAAAPGWAAATVVSLRAWRNLRLAAV